MVVEGFIHNNIIKRIRENNSNKYLSDKDIEKEAKIMYLEMISENRLGKNFIEKLCNKHQLEENKLEKLADKYSLNDIYLFFIYSLSGRFNSSLYYLNNFNKKFEFNMGCEPVLNDIKYKPTLIAKYKDKNMIMFGFLSKKQKKSYVDSTSLKVSTIEESGTHFLIIHKNINEIPIIEIISKQKKDINELKFFLESEYLSLIVPINITSNDIKKFDSKVDATSEIRDGVAKIIFTRTEPDTYTKNDPKRKEFEDREFISENGEIKKHIITVKKGKPGIIQMKTLLDFKERNEILENVLNYLGITNEK
jgi:hypothetical protein